MSIQCSRHAYDALKAAKLPQRLHPLLGELRQVVARRSIFEGKLGELTQHVENVLRSAAPQDPLFSQEFYDDVAGLLKALQKDWSPRDLLQVKLPQHPYLLAGLVLGDDLKKFRSVGFLSERDLALATTTFCISEHDDLQNDPKVHLWRRGSFKNVLSVNTHGDGSVTQYYVESDKICVEKPQVHAFTMFQDSAAWLAVVLHYVKIHKAFDLEQIKNWQSLIATFDACSSWAPGVSLWKKESRELLRGLLALLDDYELATIGVPLPSDKSPMRIRLKHDSIWAIVEEGDLVLYSTGGTEVIHPWGKSGIGVMATKIMTFTREDLPEMLLGTYKTYARCRKEMCQLMAYFCTQHSCTE